MTRIQTACYCLIASACILGGLLLLTIQERYTPRADAGLVVTRGNYTFLTAQTRSNEESLFVLDSGNRLLLIYNLDLRGTRGRLSLMAGGDLTEIFRTEAANAGGNAGGRRTPR